MRAIVLCLLPFVIAASAADPAGAPELEKLRASYKTAAARGTKSILEAHIRSLEQLRDIYARGANLPGATKVQTDIDRAKVAVSTGEFIPPADSDNAGAPELDKMRVGNDANIERALKPYRETYLRELEKLRDHYTRATNLPAATAVQEEIDSMKPGAASGKAAAPQVSDKQPRLSGKAPKSEWYIGKTWAEVKGPGPSWTFAKGGKGEVQQKSGTAPLTWDVLPNGLIKVQHVESDGADQVTIYLYITSATEGICGIGTQTLTRPLYVKQP